MKIPYKWFTEYVNTKLEPKEVAKMLTQIGHALDKPLFEQGGYTVMDLEDRGNRGDVSGVIGIARDFAALTEQKLKEPELAEIPPTDNSKFETKITVKSDKVTRWRCVIFKNIKIEESPEWMRKKLEAYGIEPKNNMVDITNYVMLEYGMPLHAFDLNKVDEIVLRQAKKGEKLVTFEGTELEFDESDLIAADSSKPLTLTTAVGGRESGISNSTTNALLEAGLYDQPTVRRTALKLNVRNESANRLGKYLHPEYCEIAIARTIQLVKEIMGVDPEPASFDYYPHKAKEITTELTSERLNLFAGSEISLSEAKKILENLEFEVEEKDDKLKAKVPYFRTDVKMEDDLIEEVLRIRGYEKIPSELTSNPAPKKLEFPVMDMENKIKDAAVRLGFNEVITQQIIDISDVLKTGASSEKIVKLENSWNKELNILRNELFTSVLKYFISYKKHGATETKLFECGKTYSVNPTLPGYEKYLEHRVTGIILEGDFYQMKSYVETLLNELYLEPSYKKAEVVLFKNGRAAHITCEGQILGVIGEVKNKVLNEFGVECTVSYCELNTEKLTKLFKEPEKLANASTQIKNYISEDFTFVMKKEKEVGELLKELKETLDATTIITFKDVYKNKGKKSVTFNLKFENAVESKKVKELQSKYNA